jgi:hypothetical protein
VSINSFGIFTSVATIINVLGWVFKIRIKFFNFLETDTSFKNRLKSFSKKIAGVSGWIFSINSSACRGFRFASPLLFGLFI